MPTRLLSSSFMTLNKIRNFLKQNIHDLIYFIITAVSLTSNSFSSKILIISNGTMQEKPFMKDFIWASIRDINRHWMTRLQRKTMQTSEFKKYYRVFIIHTESAAKWGPPKLWQGKSTLHMYEISILLCMYEIWISLWVYAYRDLNFTVRVWDLNLTVLV